MKRQAQFDRLQQLEHLAPQQSAPVNRTTSTQTVSEGHAVQACSYAWGLGGGYMGTVYGAQDQWVPFADGGAE